MPMLSDLEEENAVMPERKILFIYTWPSYLESKVRIKTTVLRALVRMVHGDKIQAN